MKLTERQIETLALVCNTFIPSIERVEDIDGYWKRKATDLPVVENIVSTISTLPDSSQKEFIDLLNLLDSKKLGVTWFGALKSIHDLNDEQREQLLNGWSDNSLALFRGAFNSLKKLVGIFYYGHSEENLENLNWKTIQYPGPLKGKGKEILSPSNLKVSTINSSEIIGCDIVVVGSGAGGGVVAYELAKAGYDVIILEKGEYVTEKEMTAIESSMISQIYDRQGAFTSEDSSVTILAGSCVGGGTTVNWSASFRTPDYILDEWAKEHDNPHFLDPEYQKCFDYIEKRTQINQEYSIHNHQNQFLYDGAKSLGYHAGVIPRNVAGPNPNIDQDRYWKSQGFGGLGDSFGYKQGTMKTFIADALEKGARLYPKTRVERVNHSKGEVKGVIAYHTDNNGHESTLTISCKKVVVAAGALHSPALLMKSGLNHPQIGRNLYLHPTNAISGVYENAVEGWYGPMMSAVCDEFIQLDGNFGYKLETPPLHSGFNAFSLPWTSGEQYKEDMLKIKNTAAFIVLTRDKFGGTIKVDKKGRTIADYKLDKYDRNHLIHGMKESVKIHKAAGAQNIRLLHNSGYTYEEGKDDFDRFLKMIDRLSWATNRFILYSAHQMGTCRMGGRDEDHPIKPNGETREIKNLFVADASAFPRCSGVNPMLSIQALAYYISKQII